MQKARSHPRQNPKISRMGLSKTGARYKAGAELRTLPNCLLDAWVLYDKKSPLIPGLENEDQDYSDLCDLIDGINLPFNQAAIDFVFENIDIPTTLNYLAVKSIIHDNDHMRKNYFVYRDSEGTQRWTMHAWDLDLTFGKNFDGATVFDDIIWADNDSLPGYPSFISPSHPLFGTSDYRKVDSLWNSMIDRMLEVPELRTMYYRRLRSLMDELLAPGRHEALIDAIVPELTAEASLDVLEPWGQLPSARASRPCVPIYRARGCAERCPSSWTTKPASRPSHRRHRRQGAWASIRNDR